MTTLFSQHTLFFIVIIVLGVLAIGWLISYLVRRSGSTTTSSGEQIYIGNLSYRVRERHLREYFAQFGEIAQLRIIKNHHTGRSKGFGFITYQSHQAAEKALHAHGETYEGRALVVRLAKARTN